MNEFTVSMVPRGTTIDVVLGQNTVLGTYSGLTQIDEAVAFAKGAVATIRAIQWRFDRREDRDAQVILNLGAME